MKNYFGKLAFIAAISTTLLSPGSALAASSITQSVNDASLTYGTEIRITGAVQPAASEALVVELSTNRGSSWSQISSGTSAADGSYSLTASPATGGQIRVRAADSSAAAAPAEITVAPRITIAKLGRGQTFVGAPVVMTVAPSSYRGYVTFSAGRGSAAQRVRVRARNGRVSTTAPTPAVGRVRITVQAAAYDGLAATSTSTVATASARSLASGMRGADVRALNLRLRALGFKTPPATSRFDYRLADAVLAFHKSQRMSRSMRVSAGTWRRLVAARPMRARYDTAGTHIEVDKRRQILMVVRDGDVLGTLHVSTGATGNTPVGSFRVYQKGGSYLFKFMAFHGNFGIHGYNPVPAFPASHGCVREPMWIAAWTFSHMRIGSRVYIYT